MTLSEQMKAQRKQNNQINTQTVQRIQPKLSEQMKAERNLTQQSPNQQPTFNTLGEAKKYAEENNLNVAKVPETQKPSLLSIQTPRQQATKGQQGITQAISNKTANMDLEEYEKYINEEYKNLEKYKNLKSAAYATGNWELAGQYEILAQNAEFAKELNEMKKKYDDSIFFANYNLGQMQIDYNEAMNKYFTTNSEQDLLKAEQLRRKINYYMERAEKVGEGNWITKDFAEYAPQMVEQTKAGLTGALGGAVVGGGVGSVIPGAGTAAGAIKGAGIGYAGGVAAFSYDQMRGAAYSELLDLGVPADIAKEVAKDTALWQSIIEGAGAGVDVATLGVGKLFSKGAKTAAQITAKKMITNALKAYGWNILSETAEEATQEMVAIKQEEKALEKAGIEDTRTFAEKRDRIIQAGLGGLKISLITGAGNTIGNITVSTINNSTLKQTDAFYDNYIEEVKNSDLSEKDKNDLIKDAEEGRTTAKAVIEEAIKTNKPNNIYE